MNNQNITRAEIEKALAETAWAFFLKGDRLQYDSQELTLIGGTTGGGNTPLRKFWGGAVRTSLASAPEEATSDSTLFTVCSDYAWKTYFSTLGYPLLGFPLNALTQGTSLLPSIDLVTPQKVIATNTIDAIKTGIIYGACGQLDGVVDRFKKELGVETSVVATGGLAGLICPGCRHEITIDPDLLFRGLYVIWNKNHPKKRRT